jgi:hypothetical protein
MVQQNGQIPYVSRGSSRASFNDPLNSLPSKKDEAFLNEWVKFNQVKYNNIVSDKDLRVSNPHQGNIHTVCLEDHRLLIDNAIDRLKGELIEKERNVIAPLLYRQKALMEEQKVNKNKLESKITQLEEMVMMQEQTIRILLTNNKENPLPALKLKNLIQANNEEGLNTNQSQMQLETARALYQTLQSPKSLQSQKGQITQKPLHISKKYVQKILKPNYLGTKAVKKKHTNLKNKTSFNHSMHNQSQNKISKKKNLIRNSDQDAISDCGNFLTSHDRKPVVQSCHNFGRQHLKNNFAQMINNSPNPSEHHYDEADIIFDEKVSSVFNHEHVDQQSEQLLNNLDNYKSHSKINSFCADK